MVDPDEVLGVGDLGIRGAGIMEFRDGGAIF
jgi:hypothetical protein